MHSGHYHYSDSELKRILKSAIILTDSHEKLDGHVLIGFNELGMAHKAIALSSGGYAIMLPAQPEAGIPRDVYFDNELLIVRMSSLDELASNFTTGREKFTDEMVRAADARKYLIVEQSGGYRDILSHRYLSRLTEKAFMASLTTFQARYGLNVIFCEPRQTAYIVRNLLHYHLRVWLTG